MLKICSQSIGRARKKRVCVGRAYGAAAIPIKVVGSAASEFRWIGTGIGAMSACLKLLPEEIWFYAVALFGFGLDYPLSGKYWQAAHRQSVLKIRSLHNRSIRLRTVGWS